MNSARNALESVMLLRNTVDTEGQVLLTKADSFFREDCDQAIIEALEKQIPQKPKVIEKYPSGLIHFVCPRCKTPYISPPSRACSFCGQSLDLTKEE